MRQRLVFMGTPDFAVPSLKALIESPDDVVAVVTQPDRPKGRGRVPVCSPVKELAASHGLDLLQPQRVREDWVVRRLKELNLDLIVVVAYGQILPKSILELPRSGCINVHASLLPGYRGASPINRAIIDGEKETGITTMLMDEGMDTGDILLSEKISIEEDDNFVALHKRLSTLGATVLIKTIEALKEGRLEPLPQEDSAATYAPLLKKDDGLIDWGKEAVSIKNLTRGLNPWPGTFTMWKGKRLKVIDGKVLEGSVADLPGTVVRSNSDGIMVATKEGHFLITMVQPENKRAMQAADFLKGYALKEGERFVS